jgi:hypothetical protein
MAWREDFDEAEPERLPEHQPSALVFSFADHLTDDECKELWLLRQQLPPS